MVLVGITPRRRHVAMFSRLGNWQCSITQRLSADGDLAVDLLVHGQDLVDGGAARALHLHAQVGARGLPENGLERLVGRELHAVPERAARADVGLAHQRGADGRGAVEREAQPAELQQVVAEPGPAAYCDVSRISASPAAVSK